MNNTTSGMNWYQQNQLNNTQAPSQAYYQVRPWDNWFTIAQSQLGSQAQASALARANPNIYSLNPGMNIVVPRNDQERRSRLLLGQSAYNPLAPQSQSQFAGQFGGSFPVGVTSGVPFPPTTAGGGNSVAFASIYGAPASSAGYRGGGWGSFSGPQVNTAPPVTLGTGALNLVSRGTGPQYQPQYMQPWEQQYFGLSNEAMFSLGYTPVQNPGGGAQVLWMLGPQKPTGGGGGYSGGYGGGGGGGGGGGSQQTGQGAGNMFGNQGVNPAMVGLTSWRI